MSYENDTDLDKSSDSVDISSEKNESNQFDPFSMQQAVKLDQQDEEDDANVEKEENVEEEENEEEEEEEEEERKTNDKNSIEIISKEYEKDSLPQDKEEEKDEDDEIQFSVCSNCNKCPGLLIFFFLKKNICN